MVQLDKHMSKKIRVLVDMDGVLVDLERTLFDIYRSENPNLSYINLEERKGMRMDLQYRDKFGQHEFDVINEIIFRDHFFQNLITRWKVSVPYSKKTVCATKTF